jgi:5-(carboxyamino)imidazole ribonucleotide synthase
MAAARLGVRGHIYEPAPNPPAGDVAHAVTVAPYEDAAALRAFAASVDVITYEFENVPTSALDLLESLKPIRPNRRALATSQDRLLEKDFLIGLGIPCAPYAAVPKAADLDAAIAAIGTPAILKTTRLGYDGKGQVRIMAPDAAAAAKAGLTQACVLEGFVSFTHEVSVIAARGLDGSVACYDPGENVHRDGILRTTTVPAKLTASQRTDAILGKDEAEVAVADLPAKALDDQRLQVRLVVDDQDAGGHGTLRACATTADTDCLRRGKSTGLVTNSSAPRAMAVCTVGASP